MTHMQKPKKQIPKKIAYNLYPICTYPSKESKTPKSDVFEMHFRKLYDKQNILNYIWLERELSGLSNHI